LSGMRPLTKAEVEAVLTSFTGHMSQRNRALFRLGINTGFRITEILSLTLGDVIEKDGSIKDFIVVHKCNMKGKTQSRGVSLGQPERHELGKWCAELSRHNRIIRTDAVFCRNFSREAISRQAAHNILKAAFDRAGLKGRLATHSMRKTFAQKMHSAFKRSRKADPLIDTQQALGHKDINSTIKYLQINHCRIQKTIQENAW
jgi:site-specific recombinase XerD